MPKKIIDLCKRAPKNVVTIPIINQLVKSGTNIGANYNKIFICKGEAKETKYWLRMLAKAAEPVKDECLDLWQEAQEFTLIFSKIAVNTKTK